MPLIVAIPVVGDTSYMCLHPVYLLKYPEGWGCSSLIKHLPHMHKALGLHNQHHKSKQDTLSQQINILSFGQ
jgi:hypothetical protein